MSFPELPLKGNYEPSKYKLYFFDTGMLVASLDEDAQEDFRANQNFGVYKGALYESIVGESLVKQGYELYYYKRDDSKLEQDFFVRTQKALVPIEVKAGNAKAKSMRTLIDGEHYIETVSRNGCRIKTHVSSAIAAFMLLDEDAAGLS